MMAAFWAAIARRRNRAALDRLLKAQTLARHAAIAAARINDPILLGVVAHYVSRHASQMLHLSERLANDAATKAAFRLVRSSPPTVSPVQPPQQKDTPCHNRT